jgi:hypothetical protein
MQYADDDNLVVEWKIIDRVLFKEEHTQIIREVVTRGPEIGNCNA